MQTNTTFVGGPFLARRARVASFNRCFVSVNIEERKSGKRQSGHLKKQSGKSNLVKVLFCKYGLVCCWFGVGQSSVDCHLRLGFIYGSEVSWPKHLKDNKNGRYVVKVGKRGVHIEIVSIA